MVTKAEIIELLKTNDRAVARALVVLNERQTATERSAESTINDNGVGFTPADARMGTSMAQFYTRFGRLSEKQLAYWRKPNVRGVPRICKYAGQLLEIAQQKAQAAKMMEPKVENAYVGSDVGNMMEERMVLEEQLSAYQEGAMGDGPEQTAAMNELSLRIDLINKAISAAQETLQERQSFIDKMRRVAV
jgi:hypothetical protein